MKPLVSQPRTIERNKSGHWSSTRSIEDIMLSQSLGNPSLDRKATVKRSTSEIASIFKTGYLLKRSNNPHPSMSTFPVDHVAEDTTFSLEPQSQLVADLIGDNRAQTESAEPQLPQHLIDTSKEDEVEKSPIERSLDMVASFFGLKEEDHAVTDEKVPTQPSAASATPVTPTRPIGIRSAPISMHEKKELPPLPFGDVEPASLFLNRGDSAPSIMSSSLPRDSVDDSTPPADYIDPHDGHRWHAKYCVLEDGILYFYRNANDGDSHEALLERQQSSQHHERTPNASYSPEDLSVSPTPRKLLKSEATIKHDSNVIWEKRVVLKSVGAVRSTEEYGECSFELVAVEDEDEDDSNVVSRTSLTSDNKLILRARNAEEMREWLFQFHRYLASLMKNIIDNVVGDIHHPSFAASYVPPPPRNLELQAALSPGVWGRQTSPHAPLLSHGHGQSALRRARKGSPRGSPSQLPTWDEISQATPAVTPMQEGRAIRSAPSSPIGVPEPDFPPELSRAPQTCPETERPPPRPPNASNNGKYVAPHLRNRIHTESQSTSKPSGRYIPPALRRRNAAAATGSTTNHVYTPNDTPRAVSLSPPDDGVFEMSLDEPRDAMLEAVEDTPSKLHRSDESTRSHGPLKLGGCADPRVVLGSILDPVFTHRSASKVGKVHTEDYGHVGGGKHVDGRPVVDSSLQWEIGAVSKCGVRPSNEDSYLVAADLNRAFELLLSDQNGSADMPTWAESGSHQPGLFAVFDGHNGNHAARFAAEKLTHFLLKESRDESRNDKDGPLDDADLTDEILRKAIDSLDDAFCRLCTEEGRDWDSGTTALIALVAHEHLVLANLGDCRGIVCRSMVSSDCIALELHDDKWTKLESEDTANLAMSCFFRELTDIHKPSRQDERERIRRANGWVTIDFDISMEQVKRMDFCDQDVVKIIKRQTSQQDMPPEISRVCGDIAVSRALGDRDYKAAFNDAVPSDGTKSLDAIEWDSRMDYLDYPDTHSRRFKGDLVSSIPELQRLKLAEDGVFDEFLLLACDGLWDVMEPYDAIRVARRLLFDEKLTAKSAAARLAKIALHLGSSDNITVIIVRFFKEKQD